MAKFCSLCGAPFGEGAKFCTECGAALITFFANESDMPTVGEDSVKDVSSDNGDVSKNEEVKEIVLNTSDVTDLTENEKNIDSLERVDSPKGSENNYRFPNESNPYSSSNYGTPNGSNPYSSSNYGTPNGSNPYSSSNYGTPNESNPYGSSNYGTPNGSNPYGSSNYGTSNGSNPYGDSDYGTQNFGNNSSNSNPYSTSHSAPVKVTKPLNIGMLIFSIINIILGCCSCTGLILGGGALAFTLMARNQATDEETANYNKIALILNIIGVVSMILVWVAGIMLGLSGETVIK